MGKLGGVLWLILGVALLGWWGFAMVGVGVVLYLLGFYLKCLYDDHRAAKRRNQGDT